MRGRRTCLAGGLAALGGLLLGPLSARVVAHTPYSQWTTYRAKHLLVGCHRADPETYVLGKQLVSALESSLPEASARVARAPDARRLASLLSTDQLQLAVLKADDVTALAAGIDRFSPYGPVDLRTLASVGERCLVARAEFPDDHAWRVVEALAPTWAQPCAIDGMASHPGAVAYRSGQPRPERHHD